jgi:hypothetical protein
MKICVLSQFGDKCHKAQVDHAIKALLDVEDIQARRTVLKQFVDKVKMGNEGGTVWYTFPLEEITPGGVTSPYLVPPGSVN